MSPIVLKLFYSIIHNLDEIVNIVQKYLIV